VLPRAASGVTGSADASDYQRRVFQTPCPYLLGHGLQLSARRSSAIRDLLLPTTTAASPYNGKPDYDHAPKLNASARQSYAR
jgi:hypothetical protein